MANKEVRQQKTPNPEKVVETRLDPVEIRPDPELINIVKASKNRKKEK